MSTFISRLISPVTAPSQNVHACVRCGEVKSLTAEYFHADARKPSGFRGTCKRCCNDGKKKALAQRKPGKVTKVQIIPELAPQRPSKGTASILRELSKKLDCTFSLSIHTDGKTRLQVHSNPAMTYHTRSPEEMVDLVLK